MTNGTIAGKVIADLIRNKETKYQELFDPMRSNVLLILSSFFGAFHYLKAYVEAIFKKSNPRYVTINGLSYGIYHDQNGVEHMVSLLCPHMKCNLVFNKEEETWDCPCHGSRFDIDGNIIEGPSKEKNNK